MPAADSWYYQDVQAPASTPVSAFLEPVTRLLGWRPSDPTFGRSSLPFSPWELRVRDDPRVTVHDYRVMLSPTEWISYHVRRAAVVDRD